MTFVEKVKYVRAELLLSQEDLANKIGVSFATVNRWETKGIEPQFLTKARFEKFCQEQGINFEEAKNG